MKNNKSMIVHIIKVNLTLILIHLILFSGISYVYNSKLTQENKNHSINVLDREAASFQNELKRLNKLMTLCIKDSSFVFALSDRLDYQFFYRNAVSASEKLAIIRQSIPYSEAVFAYIGGSDRIIRDNGNIILGDFQSVVRNEDENSPSSHQIFLQNENDGLILFNGNLYYKKSLYDYGYIAIMIDRSKFSNIGGAESGDEHVFIISESYDIRIGRDVRLIDSMFKGSLDKNISFTIDGERYLVANKPIADTGYFCVLVSDRKISETASGYLLFIMLTSLVIFVITSALMLYLNIKVYLPIKNIAVRCGNATNSNEISFIEGKIDDMVTEIYRLTEINNNDTWVMPEQIALQYLLCGGYMLNETHLEALRDKYSIFNVIALTMQNNDGAPMLTSMESLEDALSTDTRSVIHINEFSAYIVTTDIIVEDFIKLLQQELSIFSDSAQIYIGVNTSCTDISHLYEEGRHAINKLMSSRFIMQDGINYDIDAMPNEGTGLNEIQRNALREFANNGAYDQLENLVESLFVERIPSTLDDYTESYTETANLLKAVAYEKRFHLKKTCPLKYLHNTEYMYRNLCALLYEMKTLNLSDAQNIRTKIPEYIQLHLTDEISLVSVAEHFSITPVYLSGWFKKTFAQNFSTYVSGLRMETAVEILKANQSLKVYEVARMVGIDNVATFIRQFKVKTGTTPEQYRKKYSRDNIDEK